MTIDNDLFIQPFGNGIRLVKSSKNSSYQLTQRIFHFMNLPCNVYFEALDGVIEAVNERNAEFCGFDSANHAVGKRYYDFLPKQSSDFMRKNDYLTMDHGTKIFDEMIHDENGQAMHALSIKSPWYNDDQKLIGLFGITMISGKDNFSEPLVELANLGLLNNSNNKKLSPQQSIKLSKRQMECANLLLKGMTNKEIAIVTGLSPRTVESYIDNIKIRFNCRNKAELVAKLAILTQ